MKSKETIKEIVLNKIQRYIIEKHLLSELGTFIQSICEEYYPNADDVFKNTLRTYTYYMQEVYYQRKILDKQIQLYKPRKTITVKSNVLEKS